MTSIKNNEMNYSIDRNSLKKKNRGDKIFFNIIRSYYFTTVSLFFPTLPIFSGEINVEQ